jgi:2-amino-4-hydroxy-6-hydroxymethyldihydropteridine diphosphokinase
MNSVYLLLGGNLDDRASSLNQAKGEITKHIGRIKAESSVYESDPWGFESDQRFLNQVIRIDTRLAPSEILKEIILIEAKLGRIRIDGNGYTSRTIDIDILFFNDEIIREENLVIPHPKIPERMFTLIPLAELNRSMVHPGCHKTIGELISECEDNLPVSLYSTNKYNV